LITKVDLVMWTKNGGNTLSAVLKRINQVIPPEIVHKRLIVDDKSTDSTREIAKSFGWAVISNEGSGISDGANTALKNVESEYFVSFEQDLLLARDWWQKIPKYLENQKIAIVSGVRIPDSPSSIRKIEEYTLERYQKSKDLQAFLYGKTLDNTIYRTKVIRELGGFPKLKVSAGVDNALAQKVVSKDLTWKVDFNVQSVHLRKGLIHELSHAYWYGTSFNTLYPVLFRKNISVKKIILQFLYSPIRGLEIALKKNSPETIIIYPMIRFAVLRGVFAGFKQF